MPDLDRLPRGVKRSWRSVADAVRGVHAPDVVADAMEKSLAKTLRESGALPWLPSLVDRIIVSRASGTDLVPADVFRVVELDSSSGVAAAFVDAAVAVAARPSVGVVIDDLAVEALRRMVEKLCTGPLEPELVPEVFPDRDAYRHYINQCIEVAQLTKLGARVTAPTGRSVRAPKSRLPRPGTAGLLHEPLN